jgi:MoaA/NifB/PqqE/SkfB family radical SAM enzyme
MARLVIELTNRCNLRCLHCFAERHAATGDLPLAIIDKVLAEGKDCGIAHLPFTGGEPTIHRQFAEIMRRVGAAGYTWSMVSNGHTFPQLYPLFLQSRPWFTGVTFSLDGAREVTHDRLRGKGSYRRVLRAASICVVKALPFTFNMVLTAQNWHEVHEMIELAGRLGSRGIRFGHLMPTPETALRGLDLTPQERQAVEADIWHLQKSAPVFVGMAPGYFSAAPFFPCGPLELEEYNLDQAGAGQAGGIQPRGSLPLLVLCEVSRQGPVASPIPEAPLGRQRWQYRRSEAQWRHGIRRGTRPLRGPIRRPRCLAGRARAPLRRGIAMVRSLSTADRG